jgi:hypothetical protein
MKLFLTLAFAFVGFQWSGTAAPAQLHVDGTNLAYGGAKIVLRGVAVGDALLAREGRPASDYHIIATNWNANVVRIGLHPSVWKYRDHPGVLGELERQVKAALGAEMFVIIDWHTIGWPDGYFEKPGADWDDPPDLYDSNFGLAKSFWEAVAKRFGADPRVIFELWNEPVFAEHQKGKASAQEWEELKPYWLTLTTTIRAHSGNLIVATGGQWAYQLAGIKAHLLPDANTAYAWHVYAGHDDDDEAKWAAALDELQRVRPVLVTEWGFQRDTKEHFRGTPETFANKFVRDFLDGRQLHSTAWCWHPEWTPNLLQRDWETPTEFGSFVLKYLKAHPAQGAR